MDDFIEKTYDEAISVLKKNITKDGFSASSENVANYYSVWARDHAICSLAALLTDDPDLLACAKKGVLFLLKKQMDHGQIPSYVEIESKKRVYGGLGSITTIDSNLWIVIVAALMYKKTKDKRFISMSNINRYKRFYRLFKSFDSNDCGLMEVHIASDWADIINRTYHVLYDECLYYEALKSLEFLFSEFVEHDKQSHPIFVATIKRRIKWIKKRRPRVKRKINSSFWFTPQTITKVQEEYMIHDAIPKKKYSYYQSHIMPFKHQWADRFDAFGNILAILLNIANKKRKNAIVKHVLKNKINKPYPIKALYPPIYKKDKDWETIYASKEKPHFYHNGGIWPMLTGFWINALVRCNFRNVAEEELASIAKALTSHKYIFHEYFHGKTAKPLGTKYQAWSAAGYIISYHSLKRDSVLFV